MAKNTYPDGRSWPTKIDNRKGGGGWYEPPSVFNEDDNPEYPYNNEILTESGHSFEMDDTPNRERIRLQHRSNTFVEMHPNGDQVTKVYGDNYSITMYDKNVLIDGHCSITINGDCHVHIAGDKTEIVEGNYNLVVNGDFISATKGVASIQGEKDVNVGGGFDSKNPTTGSGALRLASGQDLHIAGDLVVTGSITGTIITSKTRVDAGTGMSAGKLGFVTKTGGVSVGFPVAVPGFVNVISTVNAKTGNFIEMKAASLMTDMINKTFYNTHTHVSGSGPTSPPMPLMV